MTVIVAGAAGFIGSNFVINWLYEKNEKIIGLDKLAYAGNLENFKSAKNNTNFQFIDGDIGDSELVTNLKNWISKKDVKVLAKPLLRNQYGQYLLKIINEVSLL